MTLQHKLIPSVIGDMRLREKDFSSDVGTLFWSYVLFHTKYSGSSSYHHLQDMTVSTMTFAIRNHLL